MLKSKLFYTYVTVSFMATFVPANADETRSKDCAKIWESIYSKLGLSIFKSPDQLLIAADKVSNQCAGTGVHEAKLAGVYMLKNDYAKAGKILKSAPKNLVSLPYIELAYAELAFQEFIEGPIAQDKDTHKILNKFKNATEKYPLWPNAWASYGNGLMIFRDYKNAVTAFRKAEQLGMEKDIIVQRGLVISYTYTGQYGPALDADDKLHSLTQEIYSDPIYMFTAAELRLAVGRPEVAKQFLVILENKVPTIVNDSDFIRIVNKTKFALQQQ